MNVSMASSRAHGEPAADQCCIPKGLTIGGDRSSQYTTEGLVNLWTGSGEKVKALLERKYNKGREMTINDFEDMAYDLAVDKLRNIGKHDLMLQPQAGDESVHYTVIPDSPVGSLTIRWWYRSPHYYLFDFVSIAGQRVIDKPSRLQIMRWHVPSPGEEPSWTPHFPFEQYNEEYPPIAHHPLRELGIIEDRYMINSGRQLALFAKGQKRPFALIRAPQLKAFPGADIPEYHPYRPVEEAACQHLLSRDSSAVTTTSEVASFSGDSPQSRLFCIQKGLTFGLNDVESWSVEGLMTLWTRDCGYMKKIFEAFHNRQLTDKEFYELALEYAPKKLQAMGPLPVTVHPQADDSSIRYTAVKLPKSVTLSYPLIVDRDGSQISKSQIHNRLIIRWWLPESAKWEYLFDFVDLNWQMVSDITSVVAIMVQESADLSWEPMMALEDEDEKFINGALRAYNGAVERRYHALPGSRLALFYKSPDGRREELPFSLIHVPHHDLFPDVEIPEYFPFKPI